MDLNRLRVLAAVAREGSVTAAAASLHYAQPSVSHHLARLEAEVGVPLVQRAGRGIRLTDAGKLLAARAEEILGRIDSAHAEVAEHAGLRTGRVRLAAFPSALATIVPAAIARFTADHPGVAPALAESEPPESLTALRNADVDVAIVFEHADNPIPAANVTVTELFTEPLYVVTPKRRRWSGTRSELTTYRDERWLAGCLRCREHLLGACARAGFTPDIAFETDDYVAAQALVAAGAGVTTLPELALRAHRNEEVRADELAGDHRRVLAVTYGSSPPALPVAAFLDAMSAVVSDAS